MYRLKLGLFNDSFPPIIDGVAQTVKNYANVLHRDFGNVTVVTPKYNDVKDEYPYDVFRYQSIPLDKRIGYRAGNPFDIGTLVRLRQKRFDLIHVHAPFTSSLLARNLNHIPKVPIVFTYHTKFDVDVAKRMPVKGIQRVIMRFVLDNINAADEVWTVTEGCARDLRRIGYRGGYRVMENGTDFKYGIADTGKVADLRQKYNIKDYEMVFLFVGRMMWYKNIKLILDSLRLLKNEGASFRMLMVGDGYDAGDIREYTSKIGLNDVVTYTGAIYDREELRAYYSLADTFVFPSTYDTSGIVVKEAAACDCPTLLVRGSCAAEGVEHNYTGFLAEENAKSCADALAEICRNRDNIGQIGVNAGKHIYLSWDDAVGRAYERYTEILNVWPGSLPYNSRNG